MNKNTRPINAGLNRFFPIPPKATLAIIIATKQPMSVIHTGILQGKLYANNKPVTIADKSFVEGFTFKIYLQAMYSITTQPATAVTMVIKAFNPNKAIATSPAGTNEMITSRIIDMVFVGEYM